MVKLRTEMACRHRPLAAAFRGEVRGIGFNAHRKRAWMRWVAGLEPEDRVFNLENRVGYMARYEISGQMTNGDRTRVEPISPRVIGPFGETQCPFPDILAFHAKIDG